jgi:two-component system, sensor histidine kinase and response regulator
MKRCILCLLVVISVLAAAGNSLFHQYCKRNSFNEMRQRLILIASNAALSIDAEELLKVPLRPDNENDPDYQRVYNRLVRIKRANPFVKYVYIMTTTDQPGIMQYIADADPSPKVITAKSPAAFSGSKYDARNLPELINAYDWPSADKKINSDEWGTFISGYAPIRDASGKTVAILGVDIDAASANIR